VRSGAPAELMTVNLVAAAGHSVTIAHDTAPQREGNMIFTETKLAGAYVIDLERRQDNRGGRRGGIRAKAGY